MRISWQFSEADIAVVRKVIADHEAHPIVRDRLTRNLASRKPVVTKQRFWKALCMALLTTQQPSGPKSAVSRFLATKPFELDYITCAAVSNLANFATARLVAFGGIRRHGVVGEEMQENMKKLEGGFWETVVGQMDKLRVPTSRDVERSVADLIDRELKGVGPKQSRNLLQALGLTRYEVPIDSRVTKWLRALGFPAPTSAAALADEDCYRFVLDGYQQLCNAAGEFPCVLDGAVFASFDADEWNDDIILF